MTRVLRHVLVALALLFSQQAAQMHALGHAMAPASAPAAAVAGALALSAGEEQNAPPAGHPAELCLAFHAIDSAMPGGAAATIPQCTGDTPVARVVLPSSFAPQVVFDARAPPVLPLS
jgi:hypothetical protein